MRRPNHIILDFENNKTLSSSNYWALNYLINSAKNEHFLSNVDVNRKFENNKYLIDTSTIFKNQQKYTVRSNKYHNADFLRSWEKDGINKIFKPTTSSTKKQPKYLLKYTKDAGRDAYMYINLSSQQYTQRSLKYLLAKYSNSTNSNLNTNLNTWFNLININFLRKERLYTKLKYSRSPAFDIVSGGAAALLAGFIGFLISEKFGYELVDSGDFYYLFMYLVFLAFSIRPLLTVSDATKGFWDAFTLKRVFLFYSNIIQMCLRRFK